jgi:hypothetical protein
LNAESFGDDSYLHSYVTSRPVFLDQLITFETHQTHSININGSLHIPETEQYVLGPSITNTFNKKTTETPSSLEEI